MSEAPWLDDMLASVGVREIKGPTANAKILEYFAEVGHPECQSDEIAWCAARMGAALKRAGQPIPPVNVNLMARSYLTWGVACEPKPGAIVIFPRGNSTWQGHVGCVVEVKGGKVRYVAGNQSNGVDYGEAPIDSALDYRWPVAASVSALRKAGSSEIAKGDDIQHAGWVSLFITACMATIQELTTPLQNIVIPTTLPETFSWWQMLIGGANAVGGLILAHPYVAGGAIFTVLAWLVGRNIKNTRVAKAAAGVPLSIEVAKLEAA